MIVFNLICKICSVEFEGWFENTKEFNNQKRKKIINTYLNALVILFFNFINIMYHTFIKTSFCNFNKFWFVS